MVSDQNSKIDSIEKHVTLIIESYERICKKSFPIPGSKSNPLESVHHSSEYAIVSHGLQKDPIFNYANLAAQKLWKLSWEEFIQLPSKPNEKNIILLEDVIRFNLPNIFSYFEYIILRQEAQSI